MSLTYWLNKRGTLSRNTPTKSTSGGLVDSWANVTGAVNVRCRDIPKKKNDADTRLGRKDWVQEIEWMIESNIGAKPGDRFLVDGQYYEVVGEFDFTHDQISAATPYLLKTFKRKVS